MKFLCFLTALFFFYSNACMAAPLKEATIVSGGKFIKQETSSIGNMHPQAQIDFVKRKIKAKEQPYYDAWLQLIAYADSAFDHPRMH